MMSAPHFQVSDGSLSITEPDGMELLGGCFARVEFGDGRRCATAGAVAVERLGAGLRASTAGTREQPELRWFIAPDGEADGLRLWAEVHNTTAHPLAVERIDVLVAPAGFCRASAAELEASQTGWGSWNYATPPVPLLPDDRTTPPPVHGPILPATEAARTLYPWMTLLHVPGGRSLLLGFISARDQNGVIAIQAALDGHRCTASCHLEGVALAPGATVRSETLLLIFNQPDPAALDRYALALAATMEARPWPHSITGWASWYYFYTRLSEADVVRNLEALAANRDRLPVEYIRVDDAFQSNIGDWLTLNDKFPKGMRYLADIIHGRGFKAGVWCAPFLVSERSEVYRSHPDWVVRDHLGAPINAISNWGTRNYALDTTHPEVQAWLRHFLTEMLHAGDYDYLMIDFIYAAALRGRRYDGGLTGIQAYRRGLEIVREVAGERYVLGCGALYAPSVGLVNGVRIDPDVATFWDRTDDPAGSEPALINAVRSTLAHGWMHNRLWINDPDCLMVRAHDTDLTLAEVQSWATIVALSGGVVQLSDDMSKLEPARTDIYSRLLPPLGLAAAPLPVNHARGIPTHMHLPIERPWEQWSVAALFNWADAPAPLTFDPRHWNHAPDQPYHLFDLWTGGHLGPLTGAADLANTPPHGVRLLALHRDLGRPQVVGSTLHLLGGAVEIAHEDWSDNTLNLALRCPGRHTGFIAVYVPEIYEYLGGQDAVERRNSLLLVSLTLVERAEISLVFEPRA